MRLGILDHCFRSEGQSAAERLAVTLELAQAAESWGYSRYWLSEHHGSQDAAHSAPEILVPAIAARTRSIRVGTAGVLLNFYSPLKVAETFRLLEALFPGRIDLGLGRGGADPTTTRALLDGGVPGPRASYDRKVQDLLGFLRGELPEDHPYAQVRANPQGGPAPVPWILGSGAGSAPLAAAYGAAFAYGLFLATADPAGPRIADDYRARFRPGPDLERPAFVLAVAGICAPTEAEVQRVAATHNNPFIVPNVRGTPEECARQLADLAALYKTDEIVFAALGDDAARSRAYALLADAVDLAPAQTAAPRASAFA